MINKIIEALKIEAVLNYKDPEILINEKDFKKLENNIKDLVPNWQPGNDYKVNNIKIKISKKIIPGTFIIYDNILLPW